MAFSPFVTMSGIVSRLLSNATLSTDGTNTDSRVRLSKYGEVVTPFCVPSRQQLVEEGGYLVATNPTVGTGMVSVLISTAYSDTLLKTGFVLQNNESAGGKTLWLDYLKMIATAIGTSTTQIHYAGSLDAPRVATVENRLSITAVNPNGGVSAIALPTLQWQNATTATTLVASTAAKRLVCRGALGGLNIVGDEIVVVFGSTDVGAHAGLTAAEAAAPSRRVSNSPAIGIAPGQSFTFNLWAAGSAAGYEPEFELGMFAR